MGGFPLTEIVELPDWIHYSQKKKPLGIYRTELLQLLISFNCWMA
jgi:hypothetical protein